jgi:hypothetical protein
LKPQREATVNADDFRTLALDLPEASESAHMGHPDFRVKGKIFATLWPDADWGMVKLTPEQQGLVVEAEPDVFQPVKGAWGQRGCTSVYLPDAKKKSVRQALETAWRNSAPKRLLEQLESE